MPRKPFRAMSASQRIAIILALKEKLVNRAVAEKAGQVSGSAGKASSTLGSYFDKYGRLTASGQSIDRSLKRMAKANKMESFGIRDLAKGFSFDPKSGYAVTDLNVMTLGTGRVNISGNIREHDGDVISAESGYGKTFERTLDLVNREAHHDHLFIDMGHQGAGIAPRLNAASDRFYRQIGLRAVRTVADGNDTEPVNGKMVWPRQGFDFASDGIRQNVGSEMYAHLTERYGVGSSEANVFRKLLDRKNAPLRSWEVAAFRDRTGKRVGLDYLRKAPMFSAVRDLSTDSMSNKVWENYLTKQLAGIHGKVAGFAKRLAQGVGDDKPDKPDKDEEEKPRTQAPRPTGRDRIFYAKPTIHERLYRGAFGEGTFYEVRSGQRSLGKFRSKERAQAGLARMTTSRRRRVRQALARTIKLRRLQQSFAFGGS